MKFDKTDRVLISLIILCILAIILLNKCPERGNTEYIHYDNHVIDSLNARYDSLDNVYLNKMLNLSDTLEYYKSALKRKKTAFKPKYVFLENNDTTAYLEDYRQCCFDANDIIIAQDSLITVYDTALLACNNRIINLKNQVQENKTVIKEIKIENPKYKKQRNKLFALSLILLGIIIVK